jgi:hypothetical protein
MAQRSATHKKADSVGRCVNLARTFSIGSGYFDTVMVHIALTGQRDIVVVTVFAGNFGDKGGLAMGLHNGHGRNKPMRV